MDLYVKEQVLRCGTPDSIPDQGTRSAWYQTRHLVLQASEEAPVSLGTEPRHSPEARSETLCSFVVVAEVSSCMSSERGETGPVDALMG
jgi:hypothetical protein